MPKSIREEVKAKIDREEVGNISKKVKFDLDSKAIDEGRQPLLALDHEKSGGITHMEESHKLNALGRKTPDASLRQSIGAIYEKSRTYWDSTVKKVDATDLEQKSLETLKTLAYIKLGEEIMKQDVLARHLGFSTTDTQLTKIRDGALYAFEQEGQLHITCNKADIGNNKSISLHEVVNKIEQKRINENRSDKQIMDKIKWHLPKVYAIKLESSTLGEDSKNSKVLITDNEELFNNSKKRIESELARTPSETLLINEEDNKKEFLDGNIKQKIKNGKVEAAELISGKESGIDLSSKLTRGSLTDSSKEVASWSELKPITPVSTSLNIGQPLVLHEIDNRPPEEIRLRQDLQKHIEDARSLCSWSKQWEPQALRYKLDEPWLMKGMEQLGVTDPQSILTSRQELLAGASKFIYSEKGPVDEIAQKYETNKLETTCNQLKQSITGLKSIYEKLKDGIPVESKPDLINGRKLVDTSGSGLNCLIHSLLKVNHPEWSNNKIEQEAQPIRDAVEAFKISPEYQLRFDPQSEPVIPGGFLNLGDGQGQKVLELMQEKHQFDSSRGLFIYHYDNKRINCIGRIERGSEKGPDAPPPYAIFLQGQSHFSAMLDLKDVSPSVSQTDTGDASAKPQLKELLLLECDDIVTRDNFIFGSDNGAHFVKNLNAIVEQIAKKEQELLQKKGSLEEIYKNVRENYKLRVRAAKEDITNYENLARYLNNINDQLKNKLNDSSK